jgi:hypothetical protein
VRGTASLATPFHESQEGIMVQYDQRKRALTGNVGALPVREEDVVTRKLAMLIEGECEGLGPGQAAEKFGYTRQRYFQIRCAFLEQGAPALVDKPRGPKRNYRRTSEVVRQVIRHRFLDSQASAEVIAQKLRQSGWPVSIRSVQRVIADYGLQKKTLQVSSPG